jgi:hypothetical protein
MFRKYASADEVCPLDEPRFTDPSILKNARFSMGCVVRLSHQVNNASTAIPPAPTASTRGEVQPRTGASINDHSRSPTPAIDSAAPARSGRRAAGFRESGISGIAHEKPITATGTLIRNTDPHQKRRPAAARRTPALRHQRSTAAGWWWRAGHALASASESHRLPGSPGSGERIAMGS